MTPQEPKNKSVSAGSSIELMTSRHRSKIIISNIGGADGWLSFYHPAISRHGIPLPASATLVLESSEHELNASLNIWADADTEISWQEF